MRQVAGVPMREKPITFHIKAMDNEKTNCLSFGKSYGTVL
jgi:hypothetical protein